MSLETFKIELCETKLRKISIGYSTIHLFQDQQLEAGQLGYALDSTGKLLAGKAQGDWQPSWLVIGYNDSTGDPIFVDLAQPGFPVYTAMHGMGTWSEDKIAENFQEFIKALEIIAKIAVGRALPVLLEKNPISEEEKSQAISKIKENNPQSDIEFWELLLTDD